jgi:SET domain-containing protein
MKTQKKGWGVKAGMKIKRGTFLGNYYGEIVPEEAAEKRGKVMMIVVTLTDLFRFMIIEVLVTCLI